MTKSQQNSFTVSMLTKMTKRALVEPLLDPAEEQHLTAQLATFEQFLLDHPLPVKPEIHESP